VVGDLVARIKHTEEQVMLSKQFMGHRKGGTRDGVPAMGGALGDVAFMDIAQSGGVGTHGATYNNFDAGADTDED
jgi:hypothetical protein